MKIGEIIGEDIHPEVERLLGPSTPPEIRRLIATVFKRSPPPQMSPVERQIMYNPDYEDELLRRRKLKADTEKAEAEALLARTKAEDQRLGMRRPS